MGYLKRNWHFVGLLAVLLAVAVTAWAVAPEINPYGMATPRIYQSTYGNTHSAATYYAAPPTLSANDTIACLAATQTFTNKTLTSPAITGPTVSGTATVTGATIQGSGTAVMDGVGKTVTSIATATTVTTLDLTTVDEIIYVADGRTASLTVTLPEASTWVGHTYTIVLADDSTNSLIVDIAAADRFLLCDAAGDAYSCSTMGGTVMATAIGYTDIATVTSSTWADGN